MPRSEMGVGAPPRLPVDFWLPVRVLFGEGSITRAGPHLTALGARTALVVSDPGVAGTGTLGRVVDLLAGLGVDPSVFAEVEPNPTVATVAAGLAAAVQARPDAVVAIGGGSVIDAAKAITLLLTNGGTIEDYVGTDRVRTPLRPLVAVPTTAGTGSEVSRVAIITGPDGQKRVIVDAHLLPWLAVVDPELTYSCPPTLTAIAGMDAVTHAVESYTSRRAGPLTQPLSLGALHLLAGHIHAAVANGGDQAARRAMAAGSTLTAVAMNHTGVGICHSLANPLTAHYQIPHGLACALVLPWAIQFNWPAAPDRFAPASHALVGETDPAGTASLVSRFIGRLGLPTRLRDVGVPRENLARLGGEAIDNPANQSNPRPVDVGDLAQVLEAAW